MVLAIQAFLIMEHTSLTPGGRCGLYFMPSSVSFFRHQCIYASQLHLELRRYWCGQYSTRVAAEGTRLAVCDNGYKKRVGSLKKKLQVDSFNNLSWTFTIQYAWMKLTGQ